MRIPRSIPALTSAHLLRRALLAVAGCVALWSPWARASDATPAVSAAHGVELLWDTYGVPHIYAPTDAGLFFGFGYAQMQAHGDLIMKLYGESRGRAAEYWGRGDNNAYLDSDRWVHTNNVPALGETWYGQQTPEFRACLDAFAAGMNAYAERFPERIAEDRRRALPVTGVDPVRHALRVMQFAYMSSPARVAAEAKQARTERAPASAASATTPGSNAWALAPQRTVDGHPLLLMNPHLRWEDYVLYMEAQLSGPGVAQYGVAQVGWPVLRFSFSEHLAFTHTVNTIDNADLYALTPAEGGYRFDGQVRPFTERVAVLRIRQPDGSITEESLRVRTSLHGPVVWDRDGQLLALRVAGLDRPFALEQLWRMGQARSIAEYQQQMRRLQFPYFNFTSADADGHILYLFNGLVPRRPHGDFAAWSGVVPGDTSDTLWHDVLTYDELPKALDPPGGFVQNTNDSPWTSTWPQVLKPEDYAPYVSPRAFTLRTAHSLELMTADRRYTLDTLVEAKNSTRLVMADRVLPELFDAVELHGTERARRAVAVLRAWDHRAEADSRGALLFETYAHRVQADEAKRPFWRVPADHTAPLTTPRGLRDPAVAAALLDEAAAETEKRYGALDARWGDFRRFRRGARDLPANGSTGALGAFRVATYGPTSSPVQQVVHGDTWVAVVELARPTRAKVLVGYGNATQPGSPHIEDQLDLLARKEMRDAWTTRAAVEAHLEHLDRW